MVIKRLDVTIYAIAVPVSVDLSDQLVAGLVD